MNSVRSTAFYFINCLILISSFVPLTGALKSAAKQTVSHLVVTNCGKRTYSTAFDRFKALAHETAVSSEPDATKFYESSLASLVEDRKLDFNALDQNSCTPLMYASALGDPRVIQPLLKKSNLAVTDANGNGVLHYVGKLCDYSARDKRQEIDRYCRAQTNVPTAISLLVEAGALLDHQNNSGETALHAASTDAIIYDLIAKGARSDIASKTCVWWQEGEHDRYAIENYEARLSASRKICDAYQTQVADHKKGSVVLAVATCAAICTVPITLAAFGAGLSLLGAPLGIALVAAEYYADKKIDYLQQQHDKKVAQWKRDVEVMNNPRTKKIFLNPLFKWILHGEVGKVETAIKSLQANKIKSKYQAESSITDQILCGHEHVVCAAQQIYGVSKVEGDAILKLCAEYHGDF